MDLFDQMKTFTRIVETKSLSTAARSLNLSLAAVSRQLAALEKELHTTLLVRSTRQLSVTDSGRRWYESSRLVLQNLETARADVADTKEVRGLVVVSAPVSYGLEYVMSAFEALNRSHPRLALELRLEDHAIDLLGNGVDIAVRIGVGLPDSGSVIAHKLISFRRLAVASVAYLRKHGTPKHPNDLLDHEVLTHQRPGPSFTRWNFIRDGVPCEVSPPSRLASSSPLALRAWAQQGLGIALIPEWITGGLRRVLPQWQTPEITAYAIHRSEVRQLNRIRVVLEALATHVPSMPVTSS